MVNQEGLESERSRSSSKSVSGSVAGVHIQLTKEKREIIRYDLIL